MNQSPLRRRRFSVWAGILLCLFCATAVAQNAAARKRFAETVRKDVIKKLGSNIAAGFNITADGPDATIYTYQTTGVTYSDCNGMFAAEGFAENLRRQGFTQAVCTDGANARFTSDLISQHQSQQSALPANAPGYPSFSDGTHIVGQDVSPGTYRTLVGSPGCYYARLAGFSGTVGDIIANASTDGPAVVTISPTDKGFTSQRCGTWTRVSLPNGVSDTHTGELSSGVNLARTPVTSRQASAVPPDSATVSQNCPEGTVRIPTSFGAFCGQTPTAPPAEVSSAQATQDWTGKAAPTQPAPAIQPAPTIQHAPVQNAQRVSWGPSDEDLDRAVGAVASLKNMMRDPDSFLLEAVYLKPNNNLAPNVCIQCRSRNGYGGMNREFWLLTAGKYGHFEEYSKLGTYKYGHCDVRKLVNVTDPVKARIALLGK
jgi:hypothetical protein